MDEVMGMTVGGDDFITKPLNLKVLEDILKKWISL
jgi:DNA-binding response OmpR family regulator